MVFNIIDFVLLLIGLILIIVSAKKGFLASLFNLLAVAISYCAAITFAPIISSFVYDKYLHSTIISKLSGQFPSGYVHGELVDAINNALNALPNGIAEFAKQLDWYVDLSSNQSVLSIENIETQYIMPICEGIIKIAAIVIIFIILALFLKLIFYFINKAIKDKFKLVNAANTLLGLVIGVIKAVFQIGVLSAIFNLLAMIINNEAFLRLINNSFFCSLITGYFK